MPVGGRLDANTDKRAARRLDLLRHRQNIAVGTHDHERRQARKTDHALGGVQAQLDVGPVLDAQQARRLNV
jgi:hypothetical protein